MSTEREVVEREILREHISIFSPEAYKLSLLELTPDELRDECFKQYKMSGEMLDKYRLYWQKSEDYRKQRDDEQLDVRRWRALATEAQTCLHEVVQALGAIQVITQESKGYTHNAMEIVRRLIHGTAQNVTSKAKVVLEHIFEAQHRSPGEFFDLPF